MSSLYFFFSVAVKCTCQEESHIPRHAGFQDPRIRQDRSKRRLGVAAKLGLTKGVQAAQEAPAGGLGHIQGPHWVPDLQNKTQKVRRGQACLRTVPDGGVGLRLPAAAAAAATAILHLPAARSLQDPGGGRNHHVADGSIFDS